MTSLDTILEFTSPPYLERARARPFVKWAGGKRTLIPDIARILPENIGIYWEPFVGGGAVFFALDSRVGTARLSDLNCELALAYQMVKRCPEELIEHLSVHAEQHAFDKDYYYRIRKMTHSQDAVAVVARFIYLNKTCYNGLYRVNKNGQFNVPRGSYSNPTICDAAEIRKASEVLKKASIKFQDFDRIDPSQGDLVYCDPPYDGTFSGYVSLGFGGEEQRRLRDSALKWHRLGANVIISNADTQLIRTLYGGTPFHLHEVSAPRSINSKGDDRGPIADLLITTYDVNET